MSDEFVNNEYKSSAKCDFCGKDNVGLLANSETNFKFACEKCYRNFDKGFNNGYSEHGFPIFLAFADQWVPMLMSQN